MIRLVPLLALLAAGPVLGQSCPGDCAGDGVVRVEDLVVAVRIALGESTGAACAAADADGNGAVTVDELVRAVTSALAGCPATPTPTDTPSPSPTATATATPTIPPVAGAWVEAALAVDESSCAGPLTASFGDELAARGPCAQQVEMTGETSVRVTDCSRQVIDGTLDRDGTMRLAFPPGESSVAGCTVTLATTSVIPAGADPVVARYTFTLTFGGAACPLDDCAINASGIWTRAE